ncbi:hypothetical protein J4E89_004197 [Alternaria sp. Ai002NY15]|nr:hypothetical protein J4E89_004197 [Alternaria sp. Ai002NY15]
MRNSDGPKDSYFNVDVPRRSKNALLTDSSDADMALPKLPDRSVRLLVEPPSMKTPSRRKRLSPPSDRTELEFSPIVAVIDVAPQPTRHDLDITSATNHFSLSPSTTTISQRPTPPRNRTGLTFSQATAIIYGSMAITASHQALLGLGGDIAAMDLIMGLCGAFLLGLAICVVLLLLLSFRLRRVPGDVLRQCGPA